MSNADEKLAMMQGELDNLNQKIALLEQKLKELQENRSVPKNPWDVIGPGLPDPYPPQIPQIEFRKECPKCGLKIEGAMGYFCTNNPCPCGLGGVYCGTGDLI